MPLRVKCRCGQELVVRYSEWVYVFLGIALLSLLLNTVVLVLLYFRLESVSGVGGQRGTAPRASPVVSRVNDPLDAKPVGPVQTVGPAGPAGTAQPAGPAETVGPASLTSTASAPGSSLRGEGSEPTSGRPSPERALPRPDSAAAGDTGATSAATSSGATDSPEPLWAILNPSRNSLELFPPPWEVGRRPPVAGSGPDEATASQLSALEPLVDAPGIVRLCLLEREGDDLLFGCASLLDPDSPVRRRALERLTLASSKRDAPAWGPEARALLARASRRMSSGGAEGNLLRAAGIGLDGELEAADDPRIAVVASSLEALRVKAASALERPTLSALRRHVGRASASGVDVALLVDVSQSMEGALEDLQREALWLFPALSWALPGLRMGLVLYRDGVETALDFSLVPSGDILRLIRESKAEGGGDVPEGVHEAVKAALSLGRLRWREPAEKHIVILGDAPPPHVEVEGLLALVRQSYRQGGYRVHAIGIRPEEGRAAVPSFPEIAKAGGGRAVSITDPSRIGSEVFLALFPREAHDAVDAVLPAVKAIFRADG